MYSFATTPVYYTVIDAGYIKDQVFQITSSPLLCASLPAVSRLPQLLLSAEDPRIKTPGISFQKTKMSTARLREDAIE